LIVIDLLLKAGCVVKVYDPVAMEECKHKIGDTVIYAQDMYDAALEADALLLLTEWKQFRFPSWKVLKKTMKQAVIVDGRNIYQKEDLTENDFIYQNI